MKNKNMEKLKVHKITPADRSDVDCVYVDAEGNWDNALDEVAKSLEAQFVSGKDWKDIKVTVECCEMTQEEFDGLEE